MNRKYRILTLAFFEGFFFLAFELIGFQLLQPLYGSSYYVWITVLGMAMLASASGYFIGGRITGDNREALKRRYIICTMIVVQLYILGLYWLNEQLFLKFGEWNLWGALILAGIVLMGIPVMLVTSYSPFLVRMNAQRTISGPGKAAAQVFIYSTLGGIASTFFIAFVGLPEIGLIKLQYLFAGLWLILAVMVYSYLKNKVVALAHVIAMVIIFLFIKNIQEPKWSGRNTNVIYRSHGILGEIEVRDEFNKYRYLNVNRMVQSGQSLETGESAMSYTYRIAMYASKFPPNSRVLLGGLGSGVMVNQLKNLGFEVDVVDFDARLQKVSQTYFDINPNYQFCADDFRHYVNTASKEYDIIILDLSKGEAMPGNVFTIEAFRRMKNLLRPNGTIFINYFAKGYDNQGITGMHAILKTMSRAGFFVAVLAKKDNDMTTEEVLLASEKSSILPGEPYRLSGETMSRLNYKKTNFLIKPELDPQASILTDRNNALEYMQFPVVVDYRNAGRANEKTTFYP